MPSVSIVCTVKNGGELFKDTLESIVHQSYKDWEFIIVDDGSDDDTINTVKEFAKSNNKIQLLPTKGIGRGKALNLAVKHSKGMYIAIVDADDPVHPNKLEYQIKTIEKHPEFSVVATESKIIMGKSLPIWDELGSNEISEVKDVTKRILIKNPIIHSSVLMKRKDLIEVGSYDENRKSQFDYELWIRFVQNSFRIGKMPYALTAKRIHTNQSFENKKRVSFLMNSLLLQNEAIKKMKLPRYYILFAITRAMYGLIPRKIRMFLRKSFN